MNGQNRFRRTAFTINHPSSEVNAKKQLSIEGCLYLKGQYIQPLKYVGS